MGLKKKLLAYPRKKGKDIKINKYFLSLRYYFPSLYQPYFFYINSLIDPIDISKKIVRGELPSPRPIFPNMNILYFIGGFAVNYQLTN